MKQTEKNHHQQFLYMFFMMLTIMILMTALGGCENKKPIKVGFVGCLTGRLSDLGTAGRNGAILAVEQINEAGGINGRPVELIVKDDKQDPEVAVQVDQELIEEGVAAIIGHMTSAMSMVAVPLMNKEKMLMISPTTSTNKLTGIDDYFLRITPPSKIQTDHLAGHAFNVMELRKMAGVYDLSNRAFAEGAYNNFKSEFENIVERAVIVSQSSRLKEGDWLPQKDAPPGISELSTLEEAEKVHILKALEFTDWRVSGAKGAAKILGVKPTTLESRMKKLGIHRPT